MQSMPSFPLLFFVTFFLHPIVAQEKPIGGQLSGNATWFSGLGSPYGGCGLPQANVDSENFVALNVFNTPDDYGSYPRPIPPDLLSKMGEYSNGHNCGRWVRITIGHYCTGTNDGAPHEPFCRGGSWQEDEFTGASLDFVVADSCADSNGWCRDDPNHLDLAQGSLEKFKMNDGSSATGLSNKWNNRQILWNYIPAPNNPENIKIGFLQNSKPDWAAIAITSLPNGIHGVEFQTSKGNWQNAKMNGDMGQSYIVDPTTIEGSKFIIRITDASDKLIGDGNIYQFSLPESCVESGCTSAYVAVDVTVTQHTLVPNQRDKIEPQHNNTSMVNCRRKVDGKK